MEIESCFKVGYVAKTHGLKGEVTIIPSEYAPDWLELSPVFLEKGNNLVPYFISSVSNGGDKVFVKFEEINSVEAAGLLKGSSIYLPKKSRPKTKRGEFYSDEIIGFEVEEKTKPIGEVKEVVQSGPSRLLLVMHQGKEVLIPINGPFIKSINKSKKKVTVELPDGFLDL